MQNNSNNKILSIIVVTYNSTNEIGECLDALVNTGNNKYDDKFEAIVIDNASADGTFAFLQKNYSNNLLIKLIYNNENTGFALACNQGVNVAQGKYVMLLNPDTVANIESVFELVKYIESVPSVGVVGPRIIDEFGTAQESYGNQLTPKQEIIGKLFYSKYLEVVPFIKKWKHRKLMSTEMVDVGWIGGACMLTRKHLYEKVLGIDKEFFLCHADMIDFCKKVKDLNYRIVLNPKVKIVHKGSKSVVNNRDKVLRVAYAGTLYFFKKYYSKWTVFLVKCIYVTLSLFKALVSFPISIFKPDPFTDIYKAHFKNAIRIITGTLGKIQ
jgi:GT2 family glycosyltransferase